MCRPRSDLLTIGSALAAALTLMIPAGKAAGQAAPALIDALAPASSGGIARLDGALARLGQHRRLLMIAAHPDDEDTPLLAAVARGSGGEAAYLSLSRGEGGQNLIGTELGIGLGLLRSRELEAARAIDGARQLFGGAYDFGYTRSLDETLGRWDRGSLVADIARAIRAFRPQVVVSVWPADRRAGHGQHWAAGAAAPDGVAAAADPGRLPGLRAEGLEPWRAEALFRPARYEGDAIDARVAFGILDSIHGRSILQWAMAGRSRHRSQDMGSLEPLGHATGSYVRLAGPSAAGDDLFAGVDTRLEAIADLLPAGEPRVRVKADLGEVARLASAARSRLVPAHLAVVVPDVVRIVELLRRAEVAIAGAPRSTEAVHVYGLLAEKRSIAEEALASAAGVVVDAFTGGEELAPGKEIAVTAMLWNAGTQAVSRPSIDVVGAPGLSLARAGAAPAVPDRFGGSPQGQPATFRLDVALRDDTLPTVPYFLEHPLAGDRYDWRAASASVRGAPFGPPPLMLRFRFNIDSQEVVLTREVVARRRDQARGEVRRPLRVVPAYELRVEPSLAVWRLGAPGRPMIAIEATSHRSDEQRLRLELDLPAGWSTTLPESFDLLPGETARFEAALEPPSSLGAGSHRFAAALVDASGDRYTRAVNVVDHPHVRPTTMPIEASMALRTGSIALPQGRRIGYVRGASDLVPEALASVGLAIELLLPEELAGLDLETYDVIVIGSRAYETEPALAAANDRLLSFARAGGAVIVQYQQYDFAAGGYAPHALDIHRPHDRTTDEAAAVRILAPEHPAFRRPNPIGDADWQGWVQERGLYFAGSWDAAYTPLVAMPDPEGVERSGALLIARVGQGWYVYTGLAFFRQLPAGVIGAYRLFANLLALGRDE